MSYVGAGFTLLFKFFDIIFITMHAYTVVGTILVIKDTYVSIIDLKN